MATIALVFDLDGLIVDTESTDYAAWVHAYREHGHELPWDAWRRRIGSDGSGFDPVAHLRERVGASLDVESLQARRRAHRDRLMNVLPPLPGVAELLAEASRAGASIAVASSSPLEWVEGHLERVGLRHYFDALCCRNHVEKVKPDPALYLAAAERLGVAPAEAVALEDSPNGARAAVRAGLHCIVVPGPMTRGLDFSHAHRVVESMSELRYAELVRAPNAP